MSQHSVMGKQLKLNVINKQKPTLKISIIAGSNFDVIPGNLTISHLKRKIETQFNELYGVQLVIKVIEDKNGFIISNNSVVEEHFASGDTIFVEEHDRSEKNGSNMNLVSNLGEILSTVRFMTASALEKLDSMDIFTLEIDLTKFNIMELVPDLLYMAFWQSNALIVQKLYKIYNKILGQHSIQRFMTEATETQISLLLKGFMLWLSDIPNSTTTNPQIVWELVQLIQKLTNNPKFVQVVKNHKIMKVILELSKDSAASNQCRKICVRVVKNVNGGGNRVGLNKIKSEYIPSMLGSSNVNGFGIDDVLTVLSTGSPDEKLSALESLAQNNFQSIAQATVRFDFYQKMTHIFTIRKLKTKKHIGLLIQAVNQLTNNTSKDQCIQIVQKDIFKRIHSFMLEGSPETHGACLGYLAKITKVSASAGMFNIEKSIQFLKSPYPQFVKCMIGGILIMSQKLGNVSSIRFLPGIRDYITLSLKTTQEQVSLDILKIISNLSLDEQCRYQILNLKGIQVFVKFLETQKNQQICRIAAKGLLNLAISSRENKAKVLGAMNTILQRYYRSDFDSITHGYIETILKSKNI